MWRYNNDSGLSSAYRSLHINTSRDVMQYSDFRMPDDYPPFPDHGLILKYFENYVDHFGFRNKITFRTTSRRCGLWKEAMGGNGLRRRGKPTDKALWRRLRRERPPLEPADARFPRPILGEDRALARLPDAGGVREQTRARRGVGNSACDIACEVSRIARVTFLSTRRGAHIIPKYLFGWPMDTLLPKFVWRTVPSRVIRPVITAVLWLRGSLSWYGLPEPEHCFFEEHPTISADLLNCLGHGDLKVKPTIRELAGETIRFVDGSEEPIDVIV